jgi:UDP-GlcNAc:undecaprenyl-phosphate/decaprenyl-phosphate GlcNAc-1-phosphate transferase
MAFEIFIPAAISFSAVLLLTPVAKLAAKRLGIVAKPRPDRWNSKPTPLLGGVPIFLGFAATLIVTDQFNQGSWATLLSGALVFALGLMDDLFDLSPLQKFAGILAACGLLISSGQALPWFNNSPLLDTAATLFWLMGISNAMNLLDNMDGLAPGVALTATIFLAIAFSIDGNVPMLMLALTLAGALAGFLLFNFPPASIFMGDSGSLFVGFFLGSLALFSAYGRSRNLIAVMAGPILPFIIPIFDTTFVTISRLLSGRKVSQGGRDHTSHRLARVAGSERNAVLVLYSVAAVSGLISILVRLQHFSAVIALIPPLCLAMVFFGIYLGQVRVAVPPGTRDVSFVMRLRRLVIQNAIFQIALDAVLIFISFYSALLLRFEGSIPSADLNLFLTTIPLILPIKLGVFIAMGAYRHLWKYFGIASLLVYAKSIVIGNGLCVLSLVLVYRFSGFSRSVIVIDAILLLCLIAATRMFVAIFQSCLRSRTQHEPQLKRALIYGASNLGSLLATELGAGDHGYFPVGFVDDDPDKHSRFLNGYQIFSGTDQLAAVIQDQDVEAILVTEQGQNSCARLDDLQRLCNTLQVPVKHVILRIE